MNIIDAIAAFAANPTMAPVTVADSAANCATYIASLQTLAASNKISKLTVTDTQPINISYGQFCDCTAAIALLPSARSLIVNDAPAAASLTVQSNTKVLSFTVTDSSAQIAANFYALNARTRLAAILPTDNAPIALNATQYISYTFSRSRMPADTGYVITKASVADTLTLRTDPAIRSIAVVDTTAAIMAGLNDLAAAPGPVASIKPSETTRLTLAQAGVLCHAAALNTLAAVLPADATGVDAAHLAAVGSVAAVRSIAIFDTAAAISGQLDTSQALAAAGRISKLTLSDDQPLAISYTQLVNDPAAIALLPATRLLNVTDAPAATALSVQSNTRVLSFTVTDSSAQVAANFASLNARTRLAGIQLTDSSPLTLTAAQYTSYTFARSRMPAEAGYVITKATVADALALRNDPAVRSIAVVDTTAAILAGLNDLATAPGPVVSIKPTEATRLTINQATFLANTAALDKLGAVLPTTVTGVDVAHLAQVQANAATRAFTVADTAAALAASVNDLNNAAKATVLSAISVTDGNAIALTAAQYKLVASFRRVLDANAGMAVSDIAASTTAAIDADAKVVAFTVRDSATNVLANLPALSAAAKLGTINLTSGNIFNLSGAAFVANTAALAHLQSGVWLSISDARVSAVPAMLADARVINLSVTDCWAHVRDGLASLANEPRVARIVLTDPGPHTLDAATYRANIPTLLQIQMPAGSLSLTDVSLRDLPGVLANPAVGKVTVSDNLADITGNLDYLSTLIRAGTLTSITVTDSGQSISLSPDQLGAGQAALAMMTGSYAVTQSASSEPPLFNLLWDSSVANAPTGFVAAMEYAARSLDAMIVNHYTVNVIVSYGEQDGHNLASNVLGVGAVRDGTSVSYAMLRDAYAAHNTSATTDTMLSAMTAPANGANLYLGSGQAKALGLLPAVSDTIDGTLALAADPTGTYFTYDPAARAIAGRYDFISVAQHELTHALGRSLGGNSGLDLFAYSAPGVRATPGGSAYFSIDGGVTRLADFSTKWNGDWAPGGAADTFSASANAGVQYNLSGVDVTVMAALGFRTADGAPAIDPMSISPSRGLNAPSLSFIGSPATTTIGNEGASLAFALSPASGVHEIAGFAYGRDQLLLDTSAMPGRLIAYDSLVDGRHAVTLTSTADRSFGVVLTGLSDGQTAGDLMLNHLTSGSGQVMIG